MLRIAMYTTIKTLHEKGYNKSEIAKMTKHDWKTISKVIKALQSGKQAPDKKPHPKILDQHKVDFCRTINLDLLDYFVQKIKKN